MAEDRREVKKIRLGWRHPRKSMLAHYFIDGGHGEAVSLCGVWRFKSTDRDYYHKMPGGEYPLCLQCRRIEAKRRDSV